MNTKPDFTNNSRDSFHWLLAALALAVTLPARGGNAARRHPVLRHRSPGHGELPG